MRRALLILLMTLLPLRGWAVDLMGVVMAGQANAVAQLSMPADCPMWTAPAVSDQKSTPHKACPSCQLCMALGLGHSTVLILEAPLPQAALPMAGIHFSSAERAPDFKPPIS